MFLHKYAHRNKLECRFEAEYRGKNPEYYYISPDFSREVQDISLVLQDFSRGKNPAISRGKTSAITWPARAVLEPCVISNGAKFRKPEFHASMKIIPVLDQI